MKVQSELGEAARHPVFGVDTDASLYGWRESCLGWIKVPQERIEKGGQGADTGS